MVFQQFQVVPKTTSPSQHPIATAPQGRRKEFLFTL